MKKRVWALFLAAAVILGMIPMNAEAAVTPHLAWREGDYQNNVVVENTSNPLITQNDVQIDTSRDVFLYFVDANGVETRLSARDVKSSDDSVLELGECQENTDAICVEAVGFGNADIIYTAGGVDYKFPVSVEIGDFGFYSTATASKSSYIGESFKVTETQDTFYLVPSNGWKLTGVTLNNDFDSFADVTVNANGTYAAIKVTGDFDNGSWYELKIDAAKGTDTQSGVYGGIYLSDGKPGLKYRWPEWNNGPAEDLNEDLHNSMEISPGSVTWFLYYVDGSKETRLSATDIVSSNTNIVKAVQSTENPDAVEVLFEGFGTADLTYKLNGKEYKIEVTVGLPNVGYYKSTVPSQADYLREFKVTETDDTFYLAAYNGWKLTKAELSGAFKDIASLTLAADGSYAKVQVTGDPENGRTYDILYSAVNASGDNADNNVYAGIHLLNGKPSLQMRFPDFGGGAPQENLNNSLHRGPVDIMMGNNDPIYFYFTENGTEKKLGLNDLKSSDESIVTLAQYEGSDAIVMESQGFGNAKILYTVNGKTYSVDVQIEMPWIGYYKTPSVSQAGYVKEYTVTETDNVLYVMLRDSSFKITNAALEGEYADIAKAEVSSDGSYVKVTITGIPENRNYGGLKVTAKDIYGNSEEYYASDITLINNKSYIGFCWPDESDPSGHGPVGNHLDTAKGYATDVWVYFVDGVTGAEKKLSINDLKTSDPNVVKVVDPGYQNGMVNFETAGWGKAQITYTTGGKDYVIDVVSDVQQYGYYTSLNISQAAWIRDFKVTAENNVFYFIADNGTTFTDVIPTEGLKRIAAMELSADKTYVKFTVTGIPSPDEEYGIEEFFTIDQYGSQGSGRDILNSLTSIYGPIELQMDEKAEKTIEKELKNILKDVSKGKKIDPNVVSEETQQVIRELIEAGAADANFITWVEMLPVNEDEVDAETIKAFKAAAGNHASIHQFMDIRVYIGYEYGNGLGMLVGTIDEISSRMKYSFEMPESVDVKGRSFCVLRDHNGVIDKLPVTKEADGTYSFETDRYSNYAIMSVPVSSGGSGSGSHGSGSVSQSTGAAAPATGDYAAADMWLMFMACGAAVMTAMTFKKKRSL